MSNESIIQRVKKLLALAGDKGATEAEAAAAMERVHQLLMKHNLSMDAVNAVQDQGIVEESLDESNRAEWKNMIWDATAELYLCIHYYRKHLNSRKIRHIVAGRPDNVQTVLQMAPYFIRSIQHRAKDACMYRPAKYTKEFFQGAAFRMACRMAHLMPDKNKPAEQTESAGHGLIPLYEEQKRQVEEFLANQEKPPKIVDSKLEIKEESIGFAQGWHEAGKISLNLQISSEVKEKVS